MSVTPRSDLSRTHQCDHCRKLMLPGTTFFAPHTMADPKWCSVCTAMGGFK